MIQTYRIRNPAVRAKMSAARKRAWADPAMRAKMSAASKRAWADPDKRAKMSAVSKRAWADPEKRANMSAVSKRAWADPEKRAKMSAAIRSAWAYRRDFVCPLKHEKYFRKVRNLLGTREAEKAVLKILAQEQQDGIP
jgi:hypothetical protein